MRADAVEDRDEQAGVDQPPGENQEEGEGVAEEEGQGGEEEHAVEEQCVLVFFLCLRGRLGRGILTGGNVCLSVWTAEHAKDPGIPNNFPYKDQILAEVAEQRRLVCAFSKGIVCLELREWTVGRVASYVREEAGDAYTKEEREAGVENVRTGLKRELEESDEEEDDDEEEEDEDEVMEVDAQGQNAGLKTKKEQTARGPEPETILWFAARGDFDVPNGVEYARKEDVYRGLQGVSAPPDRTECAGP